MIASVHRWKRGECEIAALLGGVRLPNTGIGQLDEVALHLFAQVTTWATLSA